MSALVYKILGLDANWVCACSVVTLYSPIKRNKSKKPDGSPYGPDDWNTEDTLESNCYAYSKIQVAS